MMYGTRDDFDYIECSYCGCLQIRRFPEDISKYYISEEYYSFKKKNTSNYLKKIFRKKRDEYCLFRNSFLGKFVKIKYPNLFFSILGDLEINYDSKILDVGCGLGNFLFQLRTLDFKFLTGIDPFIEKEIELDHLQIFNKSIQKLSNDQKFDFIIFNHSFEHIDNPFETLLKVKNILSEHGTCIISMPVKTDYIWDRYGINWFQIDAPRHFYLYSIKSFDILLEKTGFKLYNTVFNSTKLLFLRSEQYKMDIPLNSDNSYEINPEASIFSNKEIKEFKNRAKILNKKNSGDQAIFVLEKNDSY